VLKLKVQISRNQNPHPHHHSTCRSFQIFSHYLAHAIIEYILRKEVIDQRPRNNAFKHRPLSKCLWILYNRRLRCCSLDRSFRFNSTSNTKRQCRSKRCSSVRLPPLSNSSSANNSTELKVDHTTTPRKKKNTPSSSSPCLPTYPPFSPGTRNKFSSTCPPHGRTPRQRNSQMKL